MLFLLLGVGAALAAFVSWMLWRWTRSRRTQAPDVIYLGYDDQDNVSSMREAMLERIRRGGIDP